MFENLTYFELLDLRQNLILEGRKKDLEILNESISKIEFEMLYEDTSATGGPAGAVTGGGQVSSGGVAYSNASIGGMGQVVSAQPSSFAGSTMGNYYKAGGGSDGSGDIGFPFPASGGKTMYQKIPTMGKNHGSMTGKKSRTKKLDIKALKAAFGKNREMGDSPKPKKNIMSFQDFQKDDINKVTKVKY
jgi:hypothetical protein